MDIFGKVDILKKWSFFGFHGVFDDISGNGSILEKVDILVKSGYFEKWIFYGF